MSFFDEAVPVLTAHLGPIGNRPPRGFSWDRVTVIPPGEEGRALLRRRLGQPPAGYLVGDHAGVIGEGDEMRQPEDQNDGVGPVRIDAAHGDEGFAVDLGGSEFERAIGRIFQIGHGVLLVCLKTARRMRAGIAKGKARR